MPFASGDAHSAGRKRSEAPPGFGASPRRELGRTLSRAVPKRFPSLVDFPRGLAIGKEVIQSAAVLGNWPIVFGLTSPQI
jgi:hypothetical protein